jgi:NAD-dependent dihydropyrimidine dehydrogenase PreA subunit
MSRKYVAIIGAGPTGLAAAQAAVEAGCDVDIIDELNSPIQEQTRKIKTKSSSGALAKKSKFNSKAMYEYSEELIQNVDSLDLPISNTVGGLSSVWGANVWFPKPSEIGINISEEFRYLVAQTELTKDFKFMGSQKAADHFGIDVIGGVPQSHRTQMIEKNSFFGKDVPYLGSALLAVDTNSCIKCGLCLTGCPTNAIFSAENGWKELIASNKVNHINGLAITIESDRSIIIKKSEITQKLSQNYDLIYIACGAIASASLLQRSSLIPPEVFLNDTQVFYIPIISQRKHSEIENLFTLARLFFRSDPIENGIHLSIYESSSDLKVRAKAKNPIISSFIPNFFWKRILAGIGFISPECSGRIRIVFQDGLSKVSAVENQGIRKVVKRILKSQVKEFRRSGLIPILIGLTIPNVGASYHVGSLQSSKGERLLTSFGGVKGSNHIYVVDSSALPKIPIGPITVAAMINARRIVSSTLEE